MQIKIAGNAVVVTSSADMNQLKKLEKYNPKALRLFDKDDNQTFAVLTNTKSGISAAGVCFSEKSAEGKAQATLTFPEGTPADKRKSFVEDTFGIPLYNLAIIEQNIAHALTEVEEKFALVADSIQEV